VIEPLTDRPLLMGVLNVTPDSFSDGGQFLETQAALAHAMAMREEGADLIDVGGESTRPGAEPVPAEEELRRVVPVVRGLVEQGIPVSVDTSKAEVARQAIGAGAAMVNDVTALGDPAMAEVCARGGVAVCLMHMQGSPRTMQAAPTYRDVVSEVTDFLRSRAEVAENCGVDSAKIWIDPGIGFGKTLEHNLELLANLGLLVESGRPVVLGVSRKSFLGKILKADQPSDRLAGALACQLLAQSAGVKMIRTHDVRATRQAIEVAAAIGSASRPVNSTR